MIDVRLRCTGIVAPVCGGDVLLVVVAGLDSHPRPMCAACAAASEAIGLPIRPWVERGSDRRADRFVLAGVDGLGRRVTDAPRAKEVQMH